MRALRALGREPEVVHMNEGHAAFSALERMRILIHRHLNLRSRIPGERALCRTAGPLRYYGRLQQPKSFGESPAQYRVDSENLVSQKAGKGIARTRQFPAVCICSRPVLTQHGHVMKPEPRERVRRN